MKKTTQITKTIISLLLIVIGVFMFSYSDRVYAFFSSNVKFFGSISTGNVNITVSNLMVTDGNIEWSDESENLNDGSLKINRSDVFSFNLNNDNSNKVSYTLNLQIAWDDELSESGKLFVYPAGIGDEAIYNDINSGNPLGAIISSADSDNSEILLSTEMRKGISKDVESGVLNPSSVSAYAFKVFLYEDSDITESPAAYHNNEIEIIITVRSASQLEEAGWTAANKQFFRVTSIIDTVYPVISEVGLSKTFFITQTGGIDLKSYATAYDVIDGDITNEITVTSSPEFDPDKAGSYTITYNVANSLGNAAAPLTINITVWDFVKFESGNYHTLALTSHGRVYVWGYNGYGQLGDGSIQDKSTPTLLNGFTNVIDIAAGIGTSFVLTADGQAYSWGRNENGRLGNGTTTGRNTPGEVLQPEGVKFVQISSDFSTAGGVTADGDVYTWGYGGYGAAGTGSTGDNTRPTKINLTNIKSISMGNYNGVAVSKDGIVYTWGDNLHGQLGNGANMAVGTNPPAEVPYFRSQGIQIAEASAGFYHMTAVSSDGRLYSWGYGLEGRLGIGTTTDKNTPQSVPLAEPVKKAVAGNAFTGVMTVSGEVYFFGQNAYGKHGTGNTTNHTSPIKTTLSGIIDISLGLDSSFALTGKVVYGMGYGGTGVLGTGNNNNSTTPVQWAFTPPPPA